MRTRAQKKIITDFHSVFPDAKVRSCARNIDGPGFYFYFQIPHQNIGERDWKNKIRQLRKIMETHGVQKKFLPFEPPDSYDDGSSGYIFVAQ